MKVIHNPDGLPVIPALPEPENDWMKRIKPPPADGAVAICGECGRRIGRVESYCCANIRCPVYPKVT